MLTDVIQHFDIPGIDWSNPEIQRVFEFFSEKYEQKSKQVMGLNKQVKELSKENEDLKKRILLLEGKVTHGNTPTS